LLFKPVFYKLVCFNFSVKKSPEMLKQAWPSRSKSQLFRIP
jgi:hypothetical protein